VAVSSSVRPILCRSRGDVLVAKAAVVDQVVVAVGTQQRTELGLRPLDGQEAEGVRAEVEGGERVILGPLDVCGPTVGSWMVGDGRSDGGKQRCEGGSRE
jgi:hypothetical protein